MITRPRLSILDHPWYQQHLRGRRRAFPILLVILALTISSGAAAAATIGISQGVLDDDLVPNRNSGMCLDVADDGVTVQQSTCYARQSQNWYLSNPFIAEYTEVVNTTSGLCLDVP